MPNTTYQRPEGSGLGPVPPLGAPVIMANRQQVDDRFPMLGFTVQTGGRPCYEVLLATDRSLFDPANDGRRHAGNFYASRQDSGLIKTAEPSSIYLVPPAVLRTFAQSEPPPQAIYYTLIAYEGADGRGPAFAHPPQRLPAEAPYVSVARGFKGRTLAAVFGIPAERLQRVGAATAPGAAGMYDRARNGGAHHPSGAGMEPEGDRGEGEDGYMLAAELSTEGGYWQSASYPPAPAGPEMGYASGGADMREAYGAPEGTAYGSSYGQADTGFNYEDGYEDYGPAPTMSPLEAGEGGGWREEGEQDWPAEGYGLECNDVMDLDYEGDSPFASGAQGVTAAAQESSYPAGVSEPEALQGDEEYLAEDDLYDEGQVSRQATHYGDEADEWDGEEMGLSYEALDAPPAGAAPAQTEPLTIEAKRRIIEHIARSESGAALYAAVNADGEYEGRFGTDHSAYHRYHIGLSYGIVQFTQDSGLLGRLLTMMRDRDPQTFRDTFGASADELVRVTNAAGPSSSEVPGGRSARVQPVGGADLWQEPWVSRFRQAGRHVPFQAAQNELAATTFLDTMLQFAKWVGLNTDRALTIVVDRAVQLGVGGARRWIMDTVGPVQTAAQRQQALAALGQPDVRSFQVATPGLKADGDWGPLTHAAMTAALRALGSAAPLPVLTLDQMLDALVRRAAGRKWAKRVERLRGSSEFTDVAYGL